MNDMCGDYIYRDEDDDYIRWVGGIEGNMININKCINLFRYKDGYRGFIYTFSFIQRHEYNVHHKCQLSEKVCVFIVYCLLVSFNPIYL